MREILSIMEKLLPDLTKVMHKRYHILRMIMLMQPVGRRAAAEYLGMTERVLRAEVELLRQQELIRMDSSGMIVTSQGFDLLEKMEPMVKELFGLSDLERRLADRLQIPSVYIVSGNADESPLVKREMGRVTARLLRQLIKPSDIVAVTGGSTMAEVAEMLTRSTLFDTVQFVPARGGLGEKIEYQANLLASKMAQKTGGKYHMLHVQDQLSEEAYRSLIRDANVKEILGIIQSARMVVHGIGDAITMARRRKSNPDVISKIEKLGAVGEAFGYYFDRDGQIVHHLRTIGIQLEDVGRAETVIAVAGGASKASSIAAVAKQGYQDFLITDEAAAQGILQIYSV